MSEYSATIVFGPNHAKMAAAMANEGVPNVIDSDDIETLAFADVDGCNMVLFFAHDMPAAWKGRENDWLQTLLRGTSMSFEEMRCPDIRFIGTQDDSTAASLGLHWADIDTGTSLKVARAVARSYAALIA